MNNEQRRHLKELHRTYELRLRKLELTQAQMGAATPPHVLVEIDECRSQIAKIDKQLTEPKKKVASVQQVGVRVLEIAFKGDFEHLTPDVQAAMVRVIAALAEVSPEEIKVRKVKSGSIVFEVELPAEAAERLRELYVSRNFILEEFGIERIDDIQGEPKSAPRQKEQKLSNYRSSRSEAPLSSQVYRRTRGRIGGIFVGAMETSDAEVDASSPEAQIIMLTERIGHLTEHLKTHPQDHKTRRGLLKLTGRRRRLLSYLNAKDKERYKALIERLGLQRKLS